MDRVQAICNTALSIRNARNLRVRLPLKRLTVIAPEEAFSNRFTDIIRDEVNVKELYSSHTFNDYATLKLQINFPILGKRLPDKIKQIIPESKKGAWRQLPGGKLAILDAVLEPEEFTLILEPKPEFKERAQALSDNSALVLLDIEVTPELEQEGAARDLVRAIQQARKDAGFNVSDRIGVTLHCSPTMRLAAQAHLSYISQQTLCDRIIYAEIPRDTYTVEAAITEENLRIGLEKTM